MSHSNIVLGRLIREIEGQLAEAHAIAKAARAHAFDGRVDRALAISLDTEELIHSTDHLLHAATTLSRRHNEERRKLKFKAADIL